MTPLPAARRSARRSTAPLPGLRDFLGQCDEDDLTTRDAAILGDLELATENLRDYLRKRRMPYFQYCPCKNCVIGLWHLTAPHVTGFSR